MNKCPQCGLLSPPDAINCDCGYNFQTKNQDKPLDAKYITEASKGLTPWELIGFILLFLACPGIVTLAIYITAYIKWRKRQPNKAYPLGIMLFILLILMLIKVFLLQQEFYEPIFYEF